MNETSTSEKLTLDELNYVQEEVKMKGKKLTLSYILLLILGNLGIHLGYLERVKLAVVRILLTSLIIAAFYPIREVVILAETNGITVDIQQYSSTLFVLHMLLILIAVVWMMYDLVALPAMVKKFNNKIEVESRAKMFTSRNVENMLRKDEVSRRMVESISEQLTDVVDEKAQIIYDEISTVHKNLQEELVERNEATNDLIDNFSEKVKEIETLADKFNEETEDIKSSTSQELNLVRTDIEEKLEDIKTDLNKKLLLTRENTEMQLENELAKQSEPIESLKAALANNLKGYVSKEPMGEYPSISNEQLDTKEATEEEEVAEENNKVEVIEPEVESKEVVSKKELEGEYIEKSVELEDENTEAKENAKSSEDIEPKIKEDAPAEDKDEYIKNDSSAELIEEVEKTEDNLVNNEDVDKEDSSNIEPVKERLTQEDVDNLLNESADETKKEEIEAPEDIKKELEVEPIDIKESDFKDIESDVDYSGYSLIDEVKGKTETISIKERSEDNNEQSNEIEKVHSGLSVAQALEKGKGHSKVTGYIVGYMDPNKHHTVFEDFSGDLNVVIADKLNEKNSANMITVQLTWDSKLREDIGLLSKPDNLHKEITVTGILGNYFKGTGIKKVSTVKFAATEIEFTSRD